MFRLEEKKFFMEGSLPLVKGKIFNTRFGLIHVQTGKKKFCWRTPLPPPTAKGKNFWHQIWLDTCSDWKKKLFVKGPPLPVKGKIFDTRFGLIDLQTEKKILSRDPPTGKGKTFWHQIWLDTCWEKKKKFLSRDSPLLLKGKIFDTRFGLIHVQTEKKYFCQGIPPSPEKGKIFDTRFGLIHVKTEKKIYLSREPPYW